MAIRRGARLAGLVLAMIALIAAGWTLAPTPSWARADPTGSRTAKTKAAKARLPDDVLPTRYRLQLTPDALRLRFDAKVAIDVQVRRLTHDIVLNAEDLVIDDQALSGSGASDALRYDHQRQTLTLHFDHALPPGPRVLTLRYHGVIYPQASGLFALDYETPAGRRRSLFTQLENSDARRVLPCWDEPGRKAVFDLTIDAPADEMAVSNMPAASRRILPGGLARTQFASTPKMSTYLLFLALGDFERIHRRVVSTDVGVIVKRGDTASAAYALDAAAGLLSYYNDYFAIPYPLPKLDLIAGPGSSQIFDAMENWGAIFGFEDGLLVDPKASSEADRRNVFVTIAHEMAHQWFGDLVTMAWWNDLWLNEGFASWMETKASDHFHPEWRLRLQALADKQDAMQTDARAGSHPIITPITDVLQAANAFDVITYAKGSAVIRMLEAYVGDDVWRAGVRLYLRDHAYGVAQTQAFWTALDTVSTRPVTGIAHDFTLQAGVPMISLKAADCRRTVTRLELQQGVFTPEGQSAQARIWRVPLAAAVLAAAPSSAVVAGPADQAVTVAGCGPVVLNAGQSAYAVSRYAPNALAALADHFGDLEPVDQLGVLGDTAALSLAGLQPMSAYLSLMQRIAPRSDPVVLSAMISDLRVLDQLYGGLPERSLFRRYAAALLRPILDRTGWTAAKGEDDSMALLRTNVLNALASLEDGAVLTEARRLFDRWQADPGSADSATRRLVLSIVAVHAEPEVWRRLHQSAKTLSTALGREELYALLGTTEDPALARAALDLSLSGEPEPTTAPDMIRAVAVLWPKLALSFVIEHWPQISPLLEPGARAAFAPQLIEQANDPSLIPELEAFAQAHIPKSDRQDVLKAEAAVRDHDRIRTSRLPQADRWLEAQERPGSQSLPADRLFSAR